MIRQDMAKILWAKGKDAIASALLASSLLKAMKEKTKDTELANNMQKHINEWSNLAIGVLNECHSTDERKTQKLLVRGLDYWGNATCMLIAVKAHNKEFISHTACQPLLDSIWLGKLTQKNNTLKLLICALFPPLASWLVKYHSPLSENEWKNTHERTIGSSESTGSLQTKDDNYSVRDRFFYFFKAPVIIFFYNTVSYVVFLGLFAYILLFNFNPEVSVEEIVLIVWVFTLFTEELRQILQMSHEGTVFQSTENIEIEFLEGGIYTEDAMTSSGTLPTNLQSYNTDIEQVSRSSFLQVVMTSCGTLTTKLQSYVTDIWNVLDLATIGLFLIGTILRFIPNPKTFEAARIILALDFITFFLRLLQLFSVDKKLGQKIVMIQRMVQDLMYFVLILMVFVVSYAIASHSIMFPNSPLNGETINQLLRRSYWNIYGELFLDEIEGEDNCTFDEAMLINGTSPGCPSVPGKYVVMILMGVYMLLANVLLLNLLIAMFSYTFQRIQDKNDTLWFFQRLSLIREYNTRPVLCPPFIVIMHLVLLIRYVMKRCSCACYLGYQRNEDVFHRDFENAQELGEWENVIACALNHNKELKQIQSTEYKVSNIHDRIQKLNNNVDEIQEMLNQRSSPELKMPVQLENRLSSLEQQIEWIVEAMQANNLVPSSATPAIPNLEEERNKDTAGNLEKNTTHIMKKDRKSI